VTRTTLFGLAAQLGLGVYDALLFYALPFFACALLSARVPRRHKLLVAVIALCVAGPCFMGSRHRLGIAAVTLLGWACLLLLAAGVHVIRRLAIAGSWTPGACFVACVAWLTWLPRFVLPVAPAFFDAAVWEMTFSAHSYCVERGRHTTSTKLRDGLFFLLVNPTLVYGTQTRLVSAPRIEPATLLRATCGIAGWFSQVALLSQFTRLGLPITWSPQQGIARCALGTCLYMMIFYFGHSGRASFQLAGMRMLGFAVPERYHYPFIARSPLELWQRWNTYLGTWLQRYVFSPLATAWTRRSARTSTIPAWPKAAAIVVTFAASGIAHEYGGFLDQDRAPLGAFVGFTFFGIASVCWLAAERAWQRFGAQPGIFQNAFWRRLAQHSAQLVLMVLFGWCTLPALAGASLSQLLEGH
jgi:hypothetical protein